MFAYCLAGKLWPQTDLSASLNSALNYAMHPVVQHSLVSGLYYSINRMSFCFTAAHLRLPHQVAKGFMISEAGAGSLEGWEMIAPYSKREVCTPGKIPRENLPYVLHYCQRYLLGKYVIGKHRIPLSFLSCDDPLLAEAPEDIGEKFDFAIEPDRREDVKMNLAPATIKGHAFMLCHLIPYLNEAAIYWKDNHCEGKTPNKQKSLTFFTNMEVDEKFFQS